MPKSKPTQVIVHRLELQSKEREMLETYIAGKTVQNVAVPVVTMAGVGVAGYLGYKGLKAAYDWGDDAVDEVKREYTEWANDPKRQAIKAGLEYGPARPLFQVGRFVKWALT